MAHKIPPAALILGLAGLVPFVWGALTYLNADVESWAMATMGSRFIGPYLQVFYGGLMLGFMSGVLWGFSMRAETASRAALGYVLSVLPAAWAFFTATGGPDLASVNLILGYLGLFVLNVSFHSWGLAPDWWVRLSVVLTVVAVASLATGAWL